MFALKKIPVKQLHFHRNKLIPIKLNSNFLNKVLV